MNTAHNLDNNILENTVTQNIKTLFVCHKIEELTFSKNSYLGNHF